MALLPFWGWAMVEGARGPSAALLVAIAASDWLDGFLARRWRAQSRFGAVADPLADKLSQILGLVLLALTRAEAFTPIPAWLVAVVFARDLWLAYGTLRIRLRHGRVAIRPRWEGKASTGLLFALLLAATLGAPSALVLGLSLAAATLAVAAGARYTLDGFRQARAGPPA
jgi:cardiolipin synthase